jgi:hypothetical protein
MSFGYIKCDTVRICSGHTVIRKFLKHHVIMLFMFVNQFTTKHVTTSHKQTSTNSEMKKQATNNDNIDDQLKRDLKVDTLSCE